MTQRLILKPVQRWGGKDLALRSLGLGKEAVNYRAQIRHQRQNNRDWSKHWLLTYILASAPFHCQYPEGSCVLFSTASPAPISPPGTQLTPVSLATFHFLQFAKLFPFSEPQHKLKHLIWNTFPFQMMHSSLS